MGVARAEDGWGGSAGRGRWKGGMVDANRVRRISAQFETARRCAPDPLQNGLAE